MSVDTPLGHVVQGGLGVVDDCFEALVVEEVEVGVGDEAAYLEDLVLFGIQTGHLGSW